MEAYIYQADLFCKDCGEDIREELREAGKAPADEADENSYDSDEFPKGPLQDGGGEADAPQHCGSGGDCINALDLDDRSVGAFLENDLTLDGLRYVEEQLDKKPDDALIQTWAEFYGIETEPVDDEDDEDEECEDCGSLDCECDDDEEEEDEEDDGLECARCGGTDHQAKDCPERG